MRVSDRPPARPPVRPRASRASRASPSGLSSDPTHRYNPGNSDGHAAFNTGVVYFRPSVAAKAFAAAWRARLLAVAKDAWLDDQLAFNELVWHGFRNHPTSAVQASSADGRVIHVRMGRRSRASGGGAANDEAEADEAVPQPHPTPAWLKGWRDLAADPSEAFQGASTAVRLPTPSDMPPLAYHLAPLPARHFCSGHLFWEQQALQPRNCSSVHTTFVEGGNSGKLWRLREAGLWHMDPPEHYEPPGGGRYLRFTPPQPPAELAPVTNASHSGKFDDKYKAGWLVPTAIELSPRLRQHMELMRRHMLALRDALALAAMTRRTLVLPRLPCLCDRSEGPLVLRECKYEASEVSHAPRTCMHSCMHVKP